HVDLGPKVVGGAWKLRIRDDSTSPPVWRALDDVVLTVPDAARLTAPSGPEYPFLSGSAGRQVYVVPQTQNPNVIWLGWNTQDPAATTQM
ncbi:choice-of-anchor M domain-containing protein, partial [Streptomyces turgidiscabies]|uniref:choice-of-anchor M domain-containing protein n=1 Tax=Streptomyces turgidiscabies TaxID=85558 RepID=UPI0038F6AD3E